MGLHYSLVSVQASFAPIAELMVVCSSRAFPSSLIDGPSTDSTPVLFPGVDTLNHRLGAKASWITDVNEPAAREPKGKLAVVLDEGVEKGESALELAALLLTC